VTPTSDAIIGTARKDRLNGTDGDDVILGAAGADRLRGGNGSDYLDGGKDNDDVKGGLGNDDIFGRGGNDDLDGGAGDDWIDGGAGNDRMTGGAGSDTFLLAPGFGDDRIVDFDANPVGGQDLLDISAFGITSADFAARVRISRAGGETRIVIDGESDQMIRLLGIGNASTVTQADFLL